MFYFTAASDKWSKFISSGIHAVICWPLAKSKYGYLVLQIKWVCLGNDEFCFRNMRFAWSKSLQVVTSCFVRDRACFLFVNRSLLFGIWTLNNDFMLSFPFVLKFVSCNQLFYIYMCLTQRMGCQCLALWLSQPVFLMYCDVPLLHN